MQPFKKDQGGALLTALFIMTLVAIVATAMSIRLQSDIYRTRLVITYDKLFLASQAVTFWALNELQNKNNPFSQVNKQGILAKYPKSTQWTGNEITLNGALYDLQARFNLNNLTNRKMMPAFISLIKNTAPQVDPIERLNLALAIEDWLSNYDLGRGKDYYTSYYLSQNPPYYPSHQLMSSASEFRLIKEVNAPLYQAMEPFITALPGTTPININSAPKAVLMSIGNGINEAQADELIEARGKEGIKKLQDIAELSKKMNLPSDQITIESQYFLNIAYAQSAEFKLTVYTWIQRKRDKKGKLQINIMRQSINSW